MTESPGRYKETVWQLTSQYFRKHCNCQPQYLENVLRYQFGATRDSRCLKIDLVIRAEEGQLLAFNIFFQDWWIAYIYKMLVAPSVLSITPVSRVPNTLRLYAHCSRSGSVVVFGVNLSNCSQQLVIRTDSAATTAELYQLTAPSLLSQ